MLGTGESAIETDTANQFESYVWLVFCGWGIGAFCDPDLLHVRVLAGKREGHLEVWKGVGPAHAGARAGSVGVDEDNGAKGSGGRSIRAFVRAEVQRALLDTRFAREVERERLGGVAVAVEVEKVSREQRSAAGADGGGAGLEAEVAEVVVVGAPGAVGAGRGGADKERIRVQNDIAVGVAAKHERLPDDGGRPVYYRKQRGGVLADNRIVELK